MENWILEKLPYGKDFCFVDNILEVTEDKIVGEYTFHEKHSFYQDHFRGNPVTPGVILTECAAQISLACLGIFMKGKAYDFSGFKFGMTSSEVSFFIPVLPGEKVCVEAERQYFRFGKLKCKFNMFSEEEKLVCRGVLSGMMNVEK